MNMGSFPFLQCFLNRLNEFVIVLNVKLEEKCKHTASLNEALQLLAFKLNERRDLKQEKGMSNS